MALVLVAVRPPLPPTIGMTVMIALSWPVTLTIPQTSAGNFRLRYLAVIPSPSVRPIGILSPLPTNSSQPVKRYVIEYVSGTCQTVSGEAIIRVVSGHSIGGGLLTDSFQ